MDRKPQHRVLPPTYFELEPHRFIALRILMHAATILLIVEMHLVACGGWVYNLAVAEFYIVSLAISW